MLDIKSGSSQSPALTGTPPIPHHRPERNGYLSNADHAHLAALLHDVRRDAWTSAKAHARRAKEPLLADYVEWLYYRYGPGTRDRTGLIDYVAQHPQWPDQDRLTAGIELAMDRNTPAADVLAWFAKREPRSAEGRLRLAIALLDSGQPGRGAALLRETWVRDTHNVKDQRIVLRRFGKLLTQADHVARLDNLLWDGHRNSANRLLRRVPAGIRKLAEARIALMVSAGNVDTLIGRVPAKLRNDPGLVYERARWRRRKGMDDGATALLLGLKGELGPRPDKWWTEQHIQIRNALNDGRVKIAYRLAAGSQQQPGSVAHADAAFLAGWIALRFLHQADAAYSHFGELYHAVKYPISQARAAYWSARAAAEMQRFDLAEQWLRVGAAHPATFYGQLAVERVRQRDLRFPPPPRPSLAEQQAFEDHPVVRLIRILDEAGEDDRLRPLILDLHERATRPTARWMVGQLAIAVGRYDLAVRAGKNATRKGDLFVDVAYPRLGIQSDAVEEALVHAVGRQESEFNVEAVSHAGARGLMQLMPATAKHVARQLRVPYRKAALTGNPAYNARLGAAYLRELIEDYNGSYVLALAAYNAGPGRVQRWIRDFGDPRRNDVDVIDWIELIPIGETRNYVQRVMENLQVYRHLMAQRPERSILADLNSHLRPGQAVGCDKC
ncbi:MAG: lytic transglycosylase domain-containing protein [Alphaproteobacteria bacterium]